MFNEAQHYPVRGVFHLGHYPDADQIKVLSTGWSTVDRCFQAFAPVAGGGDRIPGHGKSTWVNNLVINLCRTAQLAHRDILARDACNSTPARQDAPLFRPHHGYRDELRPDALCH